MNYRVTSLNYNCLFKRILQFKELSPQLARFSFLNKTMDNLLAMQNYFLFPVIQILGWDSLILPSEEMNVWMKY
jgi:hypothetical protein